MEIRYTKNVMKKNFNYQFLTFVSSYLENIEDKKISKDYIQKFECNNDKISVSSSTSKKVTTYDLQLVEKINTPITVWAIISIDEEHQKYWTVMYPEEYQKTE